MILWINLRIALRARTANKLRSLLTMLGVLIGMAAVVALVSIGQGAQTQIAGQIEGIGANLIAVIPVRVEDQGAMGSGGTPQTLLLSDAQAVGGVLGVTAVTPSIERVDSSSRLGEGSMPQSMVPPRVS